MYTADYFIQKLDMTPHIEGGYYKECLLSTDPVQREDISSKTLWSSIYFLLQTDEVSHFHRLKSDEI